MLEALAERRIGRRDQAQAWVWRLAGYTRDLHEEYAVQRWPETKRLLGLLVNSSGRAHGRNARRLVHAARNQDRRLSAAVLAAAVSHTPEGEEVLRGARMRAARKPSGSRPRAASKLPQVRLAPAQAQAQGRRQRERRKRQPVRPLGSLGRSAKRRSGRWVEERLREAGFGSRAAKNARPSSQLQPLSFEREVHLTGAERAARAVTRARQAGAPIRRCPTPSPRRRSQEILRPARPSRRLNSSSTRPAGSSTQRPSDRSSAARASSGRGPAEPAASASEVAVPRSSSGNSSAEIARFNPTPITAQPWPPRSKRDSISTPASFRPSTQTSFGHLTAHSTRAKDSAASQTASGTASGSSGRSPSGRSSAE